MNSRISLFVYLTLVSSACDPDLPAHSADDLELADSDEPCDEEIDASRGRAPQTGRSPKSDGRPPKFDGHPPRSDSRSLAQIEISTAEDVDEPASQLGNTSHPGLASGHPVRGCWKDSHCADRCGCIDSICQPHGLGSLPPQEWCNYPPDFHEGEYVSCSNNDDCANHCTCYKFGTYDNYCRPFGVGPHPPISSCEPDDDGGSGGGSGGDLIFE